jgi:hypothetical protein
MNPRSTFTKPTFVGSKTIIFAPLREVLTGQEKT